MNYTIRLLQQLIKCKSITPEDGGALPLLKSTLEKLGFTCDLLKFSETGYSDVLNLYAKYGDGSPNLCFAGHTDVVPVGDYKDYKHDPFAAIIDEGYVYGRGAVDMKGGIAAFIGALHEFLGHNELKFGSISLLLTGDEEGVAVNGTKKLLEYLAKKDELIENCIVGEPTNPKQIGEMVKIGRRGSITFDINVIGKQGHVAYPTDNPITRIIKTLAELVNKDFDQGNKYFQRSNLEITNIEVGNKAENIIPALASAKFNIRFNNLHNEKSLVTLVDQICKKYCKNYVLKHCCSGESFITEPCDFTNMVLTVVKDIADMDTKYSTTGGTSDARFIKNYAKVVEFGLVNDTAHQINEKVSINDIAKLEKIYYNVLKSFFKEQ